MVRKAADGNGGARRATTDGAARLTSPPRRRPRWNPTLDPKPPNSSSTAPAASAAAAAPATRRLRCENDAPWLWRVAWRTDAPFNDDDREQLAQIATSRRNGAWVVLVAEGGATRLPAPIAALLGGVTTPLPLDRALAMRDANLATDGLALFAPRGRGRLVVAAKAAAADALVAQLKTKSGAEALRRVVDDALAATDRGARALGLPARRPQFDDGALDPCAAAPTHRYVVDADPATALQLHQEPVPGAAIGAAAPIARFVRSSEAFTLRPRVDGAAPRGRQLVLLRATAPTDRGALLRVTLDDEDLGPWRLGDGRGAGKLSFDLFRIPAELLAGRDELTLRFELDPRGEREARDGLAALGWWFLHEEEPAGLWLTDLEPEPASAAPRPDRAADGGLLVHDDELFLRGCELAPGSTASFLLPRGRRQLVAELAAADADGSGARELEARCGTAATRIVVAAGDRRRDALALDCDGERLVLRSEGAGPLRLLAPRLLR